MDGAEAGRMTQNLFIFGLGYSASYFARHYGAQWRISGTVRDAAKSHFMRQNGLNCFVFSDKDYDPALDDALAQADALLISIPPAADDPVLALCASKIAAHPPKRIVYLSTIGVYGDHGGAWVDETTPPKPVSQRSQQRLRAETAWAELAARAAINIDILRLAGIYGPERNALENLRAGHAKRIVKKDQLFNRIHVADIARTIYVCLQRQDQGRIWNVTDDEPAPPQDVVTYAAELLGCAPPPLIDFETVQLTPMARSFYSENKRVRNHALHHMLGGPLLYPTYREGLKALASELKPPAPQPD